MSQSPVIPSDVAKTSEEAAATKVKADGASAVAEVLKAAIAAEHPRSLMEQLVEDLATARKALDAAVEELKKAENRRRDALGVYNGIAKRIDKAIRDLRVGSPAGTDWYQAEAGTT